MKKILLISLLGVFAFTLMTVESQAQAKRPGAIYKKSHEMGSEAMDVIPAINNYENWSSKSARTGRNPQTGKEIKIAAKTLNNEFDEAMETANEMVALLARMKDREARTYAKRLYGMIANLEHEFSKFYDKGNSAAGTRVRKGMQDLKNLAQDIRKEVQDKKNA